MTTESEKQPESATPSGTSQAVTLARDTQVRTLGVSAAFLPKDLGDVVTLGKLMAQAGPMVGVPFRDNPGACMAIIMQAMQWGGMNPFAVSQKAYLVKDVVSYEAQLVNAVINSCAPVKGRLQWSFAGEGQNRTCTVWAYFADEPDVKREYTSPPIRNIKKSTGGGSPLWQEDPDRQLVYYSTRAWSRLHWPEGIMGIYTPEEAEEFQPTTPRAAREKPVARVSQKFGRKENVGPETDEPVRDDTVVDGEFSEAPDEATDEIEIDDGGTESDAAEYAGPVEAEPVENEAEETGTETTEILEELPKEETDVTTGFMTVEPDYPAEPDYPEAPEETESTSGFTIPPDALLKQLEEALDKAKDGDRVIQIHNQLWDMSVDDATWEKACALFEAKIGRLVSGAGAKKNPSAAEELISFWITAAEDVGQIAARWDWAKKQDVIKSKPQETQIAFYKATAIVRKRELDEEAKANAEAQSDA